MVFEALADLVVVIFPFGPVGRRTTAVVATAVFWTLAVTFIILRWWPVAVVFTVFATFATLMLVALRLDRRAKDSERLPA